MLHALGQLSLAPDLVITDFVRLAVLACPQRNLVNGDGRCATVAAASIVAKVTRDRIMFELDARYPAYGFARHKGYATPEHLTALDRFGPCPIHRRTFGGSGRGRSDRARSGARGWRTPCGARSRRPGIVRRART